MNLRIIYEISGKIKIESNLTIPIIQERLENLLRKETAGGKVIKTDKGIEFQNPLSWLEFGVLVSLTGYVSSGRIEIDPSQKIVSYKISIIPLFILCILTNIIFLSIGYKDLVATLGFFVLSPWIIYGVIYLARASQFDSFIRKCLQ